MKDYWRDLEIGEEKRVGDRFLDGSEWVLINERHLEFEFAKIYSECSKFTQRKADCVPPIENGTNRYGLDIGYFRNTINRELNRGLSDFKPDEIARVFARLSVTADSKVIFENEFHARKEL